MLMTWKCTTCVMELSIKRYALIKLRNHHTNLTCNGVNIKQIYLSKHIITFPLPPDWKPTSSHPCDTWERLTWARTSFPRSTRWPSRTSPRATWRRWTCPATGWAGWARAPSWCWRAWSTSSCQPTPGTATASYKASGTTWCTRGWPPARPSVANLCASRTSLGIRSRSSLVFLSS